MTNSAAPLWTPNPANVASTAMARLMEALGVSDYPSLHALSVAEPERFWSTVWDRTGIAGQPGQRIIEPGDALRTTRFFPDAQLNVVDTLLARDDDGPALVFRGEAGHARTLSWRELGELVSRYEQILERQGVGSGDRVAAMMANTPDLCALMLAAASLGALFTSVSPDFGVGAVADRFGQVEPAVLFATESSHYAGRHHVIVDKIAEVASKLPSVRATVIVPYDGAVLTGALGPGMLDGSAELASSEPRALRRTALPFDHPWYVLYSSGTTGKPKCMVHRAGGVLLKHLVEHQFHSDVRPDDRVFYFTTAGWMMWNWLVSALGSHATVVLYDGSPVHPAPDRLFDLADEVDLTLLGVSARFIDGSRKAGLRPVDTHALTNLRTVCSTGSPLAPEGFAWVYDAVKADVHLASISGGTDLCGILAGGDPTSPVHAGEIQRPALGLDIAVLDPDGRRVGPGERGELTCANAFPSMPLRFWDDPGDERYVGAYFSRFPGSWHQGDYAEWTARGGLVIHGRSDATLNPGGVRIGTAEIYRQVETLPQIAESLVIGQEWDDDTRIVLFVRLSPGAALDAELEATIRATIRTGASPRHVPAVIIAVADLPRTRSGKLTELAGREVVHGRPVTNAAALDNPEALAFFENLAELSS